MDKKHIIICGGGTGGHLMPALAIKEILDDNNYNTLLVTDIRCERFLKSHEKQDACILNIIQPKGFINLIKYFKNTFYCILKIRKIIKNSGTILVIGCGGYSSVPVILASILCRVEYIIHEQNSHLGRANYYLSYFSSKLFLSFIHTVNLPLISNEKIIWTGVPLTKRHSKINNYNTEDDKNLSKLENNIKTILITGGSQGASIFDDFIIEAIENIKSIKPDLTLQVIQQTKSDKKIEYLRSRYDKLQIKAEISNFFHNLDIYYKQADLFIGRAGASTISEIINYEIPSILIPYPYAKDDHQQQNAMNLSKFGAGKLILQNELNIDVISSEMIKILLDNEVNINMQKKLRALKINTPEIIMAEVKKVIDK